MRQPTPTNALPTRSRITVSPRGRRAPRSTARLLARGSIAAALLLATAAPRAAAQDAPGPIVSGTIDTAITNGEANLSFAGSAGYRFNRVFGFALELSYVPSMSPGEPEVPVYFRGFEQSLLIATNNIRLEVPTITRRVTPFVIAGVGIASVETRYSISPISTTLVADLASLGNIIPTSLVLSERSYSTTSTGLAMTIGGGVGIGVTSRFSIDVDLREVHVHGSDGGDLGRFGVGASYRF
jgi:opacity protein-like surface antigen